MTNTLLSRDAFKTAVFDRDQGKCVICHETAVDAHHIVDRSLWDSSQGYLLDNGVSLCARHHVDAEMTIFSCDQLRSAAGITNVVLPDHFYHDERYDHWGNIVLPSGMRIKGELFGQENVQKILKQAGLLGSFFRYVKYPRTYHFPWSENLQNDDRMHEDPSVFLNRNAVATVKMDGENTTLYSDYIHARSIDSKHHESRNWVKALHGRIAHEIPEGWRICGENLYATHSIHYKNLDSYFYVFSIWDENNTALSWNDTEQYAALLGLHTVPVLCKGMCSSIDGLKAIVEKNLDGYAKETGEAVEGYVIRIMDPIPYKDFRRYVAKSVRKDHVQTGTHWMTKKIVPNELRT